MRFLQTPAGLRIDRKASGAGTRTILITYTVNTRYNQTVVAGLVHSVSTDARSAFSRILDRHPGRGGGASVTVGNIVAAAYRCVLHGAGLRLGSTQTHTVGDKTAVTRGVVAILSLVASKPRKTAAVQRLIRAGAVDARVTSAVFTAGTAIITGV
jgi:hypothetical protein